MKLTNPFVLLVLIAALIAGGLAWHSGSKANSNTRLETASGSPTNAALQVGANDAEMSKAIDEIAARSEKWSDVVRLASRTPRFGLAPIVKDMQDQVRSNESVAFPSCLGPGKSVWLESQREVVEGFLGFMETTSDARLAEHVAAAARAKRNFEMVLDSCRPIARAP